MFETTFTLGQYPMDWIEEGVAWLGDKLTETMPDGPLKAMLVDGVIGGVGSVIVFLPQILILYFFISLMEDSGYMARAAFIMDKLMHKMGLHGKSFIPLIMGFGCNVPAVMATRTIESRRSRIITMMILPFMSCSARLPIYIMIAGTFFSLQYRSWVLLSLYAIGILMSVVVSKIFSSLVIKGEDTPFVMELPPYRWPTPKAIWRHTWEKGKEYLKKMGGIILVASIIVWALGYYPHNDALDVPQQQEQSYIGRMGKTIEPIFTPQGFNWKLDVSLIAGVGAKEIVASTIGVLYSGDDSFGDDDTFSDDTEKYTHLRQMMLQEGITPLAAYAYLIFRHHTAGSLRVPYIYIALLPLYRHHCRHQERDWLLALGHLRRRLYHRRRLDRLRPRLPDWQIIRLKKFPFTFLLRNKMCTFVTDMEKIILGIDPGTNLMGYGLLKVVDGKAQMITMGVIDLRKFPDAYMKLGHIFERVTGIIDGYLPDEMAIEAPFFGKNVQSMLKLGRAQGTAIAAAIHHGVPIHEYAPMKIKMALTGTGSASKEQVAGMLQRLLKIPNEEMGKFMDATDALAAAYCHYLQMGRPESEVKYRGWKDFVSKNPGKVKK